MTLVEFLRARLDEDERAAREAISALSCEDGVPVWPDYQTYSDGDLNIAYDYLTRFQPARVLREVEAKRQVIAEHAPNRHGDCRTCGGSDSCGCMGGVDHPCDTLRLLALPYAARPDYDPAWRR
jgi:hypothetical protein